MVFVVCVKLVPDLSGVKLSRSSNSMIETKSRILSEESKAALQKAAQSKSDQKVIAVGVCDAQNSSLLREAAAYGAGEVHALCAQTEDACVIATSLAAFCKEQGAKAIFCGERSITHRTGEIPHRLAAALDLEIAHDVKEGAVILCGGEVAAPSALKIMKSAKMAVSTSTLTITQKERFIRQRIIIPEA